MQQVIIDTVTSRLHLTDGAAISPAAARELTEKLAQRFAAADPLNQARAAVTPPAQAAAAKPGANAAAAPPAAKPKPA